MLYLTTKHIKHKHDLLLKHVHTEEDNYTVNDNYKVSIIALIENKVHNATVKITTEEQYHRNHFQNNLLLVSVVVKIGIV